MNGAYNMTDYASYHNERGCFNFIIIEGDET